ncbi:MAG TPA: VWA domain-containing protein [Blastocatellia bacterium]|nr:VWA domain-containing protein [Blastocatellia bacterium]
MEQVVSFLFKYNEAVFSKSQFSFGARPSVLVIVALLAGLGLLAYFLYAVPAVRLALRWRIALIALRCALVLIILFCVMRPVIVVPSVVPQASYVPVLMDNSASMQLPDEGSHTRLESVKQLMSANSQFYSALSDKFKLRAYKFSTQAERVQNASELSGSGEETNLAGALDQASRESAGLPVTGVVVISDGANNAGASDDERAGNLSTTLAALRSRGLPVFAVGVGPVSLEGDVEMVRASGPRRSLSGSPVSTEMLVRASGARKSVTIDLAEDNHLLRSQEVPVQGDSTTVARVTFTPSSPGLHRYKLTARPPSDDPVPDNNSQELVIDVVDWKPKILYIEGEPRWEYAKLREAVAEEKNIVLVSVLRSADGKFYRQGVENAEELVNGFPKSEEDLFKYDALIIGSVEATFFTFDQLKAVEQFVSRRGGTLLALGGSKAFNIGGYGNTPLADLLPIYLNGPGETPGESQTFKAAPADRGRDHPAARLVDQPDANAKAWEMMPALTLPEVITDTKPGASAILEARSIKEKNRVVPLLVEERYGRGKTMALLASDTWRWRMMLESKNQSFETFWRNLMRYSVESTPRPVEASTDRSFYGTSEQVRIRAEVADEKFIRISDAAVSAHLISPSGRAFDVPMKQTIEGGFEGYACAFHPEEDGLYRVEVAAKRAGSKQTGVLAPAQTSFIVGALNREARDAAQNIELLKRIATETGGGYYTAAQGNKLLDDITHTEGAGSVRVSYDLWDMPINFLLIVGLAAGEWFVRKRKGLA